jgi:hypothetical protein
MFAACPARPTQIARIPMEAGTAFFSAAHTRQSQCFHNRHHCVSGGTKQSQTDAHQSNLCAMGSAVNLAILGSQKWPVKSFVNARPGPRSGASQVSREARGWTARGTRLQGGAFPEVAALCRSFAGFIEMTVGSRIKVFAVAAALAVGTSGVAMAAYPCAPGYALYGGVCSRITGPRYSNPVSGAVSGETAGAANGYATGGPLGAIVGGAIGTATGAVTGTAHMVTGAAPPPACGAGYVYYNRGAIRHPTTIKSTGSERREAVPPAVLPSLIRPN